MDLEINIKVPLGAGVSVSQQTEPGAEAVVEPPQMPELLGVEADIGSGEAPPPSLAELGLEPVVRQPEPSTEVAPPSLAELGLTAEAAPADEPEPPSLQMLEAESGEAVSEAFAAPPALEELGVETAYDTEEMEPPEVVELEAILAEGFPSPKEPRPAKKAPARKGRANLKATSRTRPPKD